NPLHVLGGHVQPGQDGFFFHPLNPMDGCQTVAFGQQSQAFNDGFLSVMSAIEHGADRLDKGAVTGTTLLALGTGLGSTKPAHVTLIHFSIITTAWIPAERAGMHKGYLFHHRPSTC